LTTAEESGKKGKKKTRDAQGFHKTPADCALDLAALDVRVRHGRAHLFPALSDIPATAMKIGDWQV